MSAEQQQLTAMGFAAADADRALAAVAGDVTAAVEWLTAGGGPEAAASGPSGAEDAQADGFLVGGACSPAHCRRVQAALKLRYRFTFDGFYDLLSKIRSHLVVQNEKQAALRQSGMKWCNPRQSSLSHCDTSVSYTHLTLPTICSV